MLRNMCDAIILTLYIPKSRQNGNGEEQYIRGTTDMLLNYSSLNILICLACNISAGFFTFKKNHLAAENTLVQTANFCWYAARQYSETCNIL